MLIMIFIVYKYMTLCAILFVNLTDTHKLGTHDKHNKIPVHIYIPRQTGPKYIGTQNNNVDSKNQDVIENILKKIVYLKNQSRPKEQRYINEGNVYKCKFNRILCGDGLERKSHSGRTHYDTGYPWLDSDIPFIDLTKNDISEFSKDYLDINDLARSDLDRFSKDYLDVDDLSRRTGERRSSRIKMQPIVDLFNLRRSINHNGVTQTKESFKKQSKARADSSDTSDETTSDDLNEGAVDIKRNRFKIVKPKDSEVSSSEEESSIELPVEKNINRIKDESQSDYEEILNKKDVDYYVYMQGRNRMLNDNDSDRRRRLEHFIPKRFHWDEDEFKNLGYYWFNGDRGRFAEAWRPGNL